MAGRMARRWAGVCGLVAPLLMFIFIAAAISQAPWWSIRDQSISRLAGGPGDTPTWSATGAPAVLLNIGLVISGAMMFFFILELRRTSDFPGTAGNVGTAALLTASIFMLLIGVFPLTTGLVHDFVSYAFFIFTAIALILLGVSLAKVPKRRTRGYLVLALGIMVVVPFLVPRPFDGLAIPEFLGMVPLIGFSLVMGLKMASARMD